MTLLNKKVLITGGSGYVGNKLALQLTNFGANVIIIDTKIPVIKLNSNIEFIKCDITNFEELKKNFENVNYVFHLASYGMSGREQFDRSRIEETNVIGTENVIKACLEKGVGSLIYTSTYNVVFGGLEIHGGDEAMPYFPIDQHVDEYSRSKCLAEMQVLEADGRNNINPSGVELISILRTCVLRLAGIYGPGEERHFPRIVKYIKNGWFRITFGSKSSQVQFLHIDNLIQALIKSARALTEEKNYVAAGQAYFISDGEPINNFEFLKDLVKSLGHTFPKVNLPLSIVYYFAFLIEIVHWCCRRFYNFQPLLTRAEVYKTGVTHYFSIEKARKQLGYEPEQVNDIGSVIRWYTEEGNGGVGKKGNKKINLKDFKRNKSNLVLFLESILLAFVFFTCLMAFIPLVK